MVRLYSLVTHLTGNTDDLTPCCVRRLEIRQRLQRVVGVDPDNGRADMASPDSNHYHHQHPVYSHHDHQNPPLPPQGMSHDHYSDRPLHYPEPPAPLPRHVDLDQPLDLSVSRSPRPASAGSFHEGAAKRGHLEEAVGMGRGGGHSPGMCMMRGCGCHGSMPIHPSHHYGRHRHSPYPQYSPAGGHGSPAVGEVQGYPPHPHYPVPQHPPPPPPVSSAPSVMYGYGSSSSSRFTPPPPPPPPPQELRCRSPGLAGPPMPPYSGEMMQPGTSPGGFLCPPPHSTASPLSLSPHQQDSSPHTPPQVMARARDMSPRPFHRPFEDVSRPPMVDVSHTSGGGNRMAAVDPPYPSDAEISASSTLLMLSSTQSRSSSSSAVRQTADSSLRDYDQQQQDTTAAKEEDAMLTDTDSGKMTYHQLTPASQPAVTVPSQKAVLGGEQCDSNSYGQARHSDEKALGPAQDSTVASSLSPDDLNDSTATAVPKPESKKKESRFIKVVGKTPLLALREDRAKRQAQLTKERMKELARRQERHNTDSNDSEGGSDVNSSGQPSPKSSDGSDNDLDKGFPIPPDPNLKMSALDYLISKVLVEHRDIPFKACNTEIKEIYTGAKKGRLTLVDLIELQVEASLKA